MSNMQAKSAIIDSIRVHTQRGFLAIFLLLSATGCPLAQAETHANATLHISVTVIPIVQAEAMAASTPGAGDLGSIKYNAEPVVVTKTYELRNISVVANEQEESKPAVLETATTLID